VSFEIIQVNVLAFINLVGIAFYGFNTTMLALDLVLTLLVESIPSLAVVVSSSALFSPCRLNVLARAKV
jgi:hypothetical protein